MNFHNLKQAITKTARIALAATLTMTLVGTGNIATASPSDSEIRVAIRNLDSHDSRVRLDAVNEIEDCDPMRNPLAVDALIVAMEDENELVRGSAVESGVVIVEKLREINDRSAKGLMESVIRGMVGQLHDENPELAGYATFDLIHLNMNHPMIIQALTNMIKDNRQYPPHEGKDWSDFPMERAAIALVEIEGPTQEVIETLVYMLDNPSDYLRKLALELLQDFDR
jgi:HEAT repeat protein